jgi:hypothetical protein
MPKKITILNGILKIEKIHKYNIITKLSRQCILQNQKLSQAIIQDKPWHSYGKVESSAHLQIIMCRLWPKETPDTYLPVSA